MEFLTRDQCFDFAKRAGVVAKPSRDLPRIAKKHAAVFYAESIKPIARRSAEIVAEWFPKYETALLWISGWPFGDGWGEHDSPMRTRPEWKRFHELRRSQGEQRRLHDAPGHLLGTEERTVIANLSELAIVIGWDSMLLAKPNRAVIYLSHDDDITVQSDRNISSLSAALAELGLTRGDVR